VGYVFRLEKGCFGEEKGGHGRAMGHWGAVLGCCFENARNQGWHSRAKEHGAAVPSCCLRMLGFCTVLPVCVVFVFLFRKRVWAANLVKWQPRL